MCSVVCGCLTVVVAVGVTAAAAAAVLTEFTGVTPHHSNAVTIHLKSLQTQG
jgi:hypothetical protein